MAANGDGRGEFPEYEDALTTRTVTLVHLVEAYRLSRSDDNRTRRLAAASYLDRLTATFADTHGRIIDSYFGCRLDAAAIVVERATGPEAAAPVAIELLIECPREALAQVPAEFEAALARCRALAEEAAQLLIYPRNIRYVHVRVQSVAAFLLSGLEALGRRPVEDRENCLEHLLERARKDLQAIEDKVDHLARWNAQYAYTEGMLAGLVAALVLAAAVEAGLRVAGAIGLPPFMPLVALVSGAMGAVLSAMIRLGRQKLPLNPVAEPSLLRRLGSYRPGVGAVLGAGVVVLVYSGLLGLRPPTDVAPLLFAGAVSLLAGFNERFAQATFSEATRKMTRTDETAEVSTRPASGSGGARQAVAGAGAG